MHLVIHLLGAKLDLRESEGIWWLKAFPLQAIPQTSSCDSVLGKDGARLDGYAASAGRGLVVN
jgi:hypothetical protein